MKQQMTVGELLDALEGYDEDTPVVVAVQPNYPFVHRITEASGFSKDHLEDDGLDESYLTDPLAQDTGECVVLYTVQERYAPQWLIEGSVTGWQEGLTRSAG